MILEDIKKLNTVSIFILRAAARKPYVDVVLTLKDIEHLDEFEMYKNSYLTEYYSYIETNDGLVKEPRYRLNKAGVEYIITYTQMLLL